MFNSLKKPYVRVMQVEDRKLELEKSCRYYFQLVPGKRLTRRGIREVVRNDYHWACFLL